MQISALEVAKLLSVETPGPTKQGTVDVEFREITPDALPKSVEPDAAEVARVVEMVKAAPDVREDIVMKLKERIEKGEYSVSGEEIAEMMVRRMKADRVG
jgi:anti-sigma28 factor (negative regulator of flagellin synthesis)